MRNKEIIKSTVVFSEHKPFDWKEILEENRKVVFPSRFYEEACALILKQQEEIAQLRCRLTKVKQKNKINVIIK